jgi:NADH:ubiquinone oxidoreductase subunit 2 (subunit N)
MSSLTLLILLVIILTVLGIGIYLQWIKHYYWTDEQREKRRKQNKFGWLD